MTRATFLWSMHHTAPLQDLSYILSQLTGRFHAHAIVGELFWVKNNENVNEKLDRKRDSESEREI